ncbi:HAMP domain-containing histidine kinase [Arthrobacter sp. 24S4-2]|nr:HAMP domain-containing histidine kinase [Arthrobacter sp. 24S4-2]
MNRRAARRRRFQPSLRRRLAGVISATVAAVILLVAGATYLVVLDQLESNQDVSLLREATRIQRLVHAQANYVASGSDSCSFAAEPACSRTITAAEPVENSGDVLRLTPAANDVAAGRSGTVYYTATGAAGSVRVVVVPAEAGRAIIVGVPTLLTDRAIARVKTAILATGGAGILLAGIVGFLTATVGLRPVRSLAAVIERVARTRDPDERVDVDRDDELGRLATSFSAMLHELSLARAAQQQLVADASHELRTPLTTLRTNFALLKRESGIAPERRRELASAIDRELVEMQGLVTDLVDLARGEEPIDVAESIDVVPVFREALAAAARHWPAAAFTLTSPQDAEPRVMAERGRLLRLGSVLLDNAGKYGSTADRPAVEVSIEPHDENVRFVIADRGPGIPGEELERVFDRFYRSPASRGMAGSGLGLAIAHQIVASLGGTIEAQARPGVGTIMVVELPAA